MPLLNFLCGIILSYFPMGSVVTNRYYVDLTYVEGGPVCLLLRIVDNTRPVIPQHVGAELLYACRTLS